MKNLHKTLLKISVLCFLSVYSINANAQVGINYSYDATGNRIKRKVGVYLQKSETPVKDSLTIIKNDISVYPNPASDKINVTVTAPLAENKKITAYLVDNNGRTLITQEVNTPSFAFDISQFKPGIYFIKISMGKEQLSYQVVKTY